MKTKLTQSELQTLEKVASEQYVDNLSTYTQVKNNQEKGLLGSLVKKSLIYNCYGNDYDKVVKYMFCLTQKGFEVCKENNISTSHIEIY